MSGIPKPNLRIGWSPISLAAGVWLVAAFLSSGSVYGQEDVELQERRFRQSIHAYLGRSKARTTLAEALTQQAKSQKLGEKKLERLQELHKQAVSDFVAEQATAWVAKKLNRQIFRAQSSSLTKSTYLIEKSESWQAMLARVLTAEELKAWNSARDKTFEGEKAEFEQLNQQIAAQEAKQREADKAQAIAMARHLLIAGPPVANLRGQRSRLLFCCRTLVTVSQESTQAGLESEIEWLSDAYELAEPQVRRLQLAARGVSKKLVRGILSRLDEIKAETASDPDVADAQTEEIIEIFEKLTPASFVNNPTIPTRDLPPRREAAKDPLWIKAVKSTLNDEQHASYIHELQQREEFARETHVRWIVLTIDREVRLRAEQRGQISKALSEHDGPLDDFATVPFESLYSTLPSSLSEQLDLVLTERQRKRMQGR